MKKTLFVLAMSMGVASAASIAYTDMTDSQKVGLLSAWSFDSSSAPDKDSIGFGDSSGFSYNEDGYAVIKSSTGTPYNTSCGNLFSDGNFTISLDINYIGSYNWEAILDLTSTGALGDANTIQLSMNKNTKELMLCSGVAGGATYAGTANGGNLGTGLLAEETLNWATVTIVSNATDNILNLYVNGEVKGTWSGDAWTAAEGNSLALKGIQIGAVLGGTRKINDVQIDNIAIWNTALSGTEVAALIVPEPATASLSLLGLAALMIRRRRA